MRLESTLGGGLSVSLSLLETYAPNIHCCAAGDIGGSATAVANLNHVKVVPPPTVLWVDAVVRVRPASL